MICQAVYVPTRWNEDLLQASSMALESAFMGMCHFCFRCRRPACPECWDDVHGICAECGQESHLPFRRAAAPLSPQLFTAPRRAQLEREQSVSAPLTCSAPGKFRSASQMSIEETVTASIQAVAPQKPGRAGEVEVDERATLPEKKGNIGRSIERVILLLLCVVLGMVILLVAATSISEDVNTFVASILHIDIRAEIAYLWQLIIHLFS